MEDPSEPSVTQLGEGGPSGLRDPLSASFHPGRMAWPSTLLSWASGGLLVLVLVAFEAHPTWRPAPSLAPAAAGLVLAFAVAVAGVGSRRAGPLFPRLWVLAVASSGAATSAFLAFGPAALHPPLTDFAVALFAAAATLLPRIYMPRHFSPAHLGLLGPAVGLASTLVLAGVDAVALEAPRARADKLRQQELTRLCRDLAAAWTQDLAPLVTGSGQARLGGLEKLSRRLADSPNPWGPRVPAPCAEAAAAVLEAVRLAPTPDSLAAPVFEHRPRPESAGLLSENLPRDPRSMCRLHRSLAATADAVAARVGESAPDAAASLRQARLAKRMALGRNWLAGWLLPCWDLAAGPPDALPRPSAVAPSRAPASRLAAPPNLPAGRPDLWLRLPMTQARALAEHTPTCALRPSHRGLQRRWQAFDCVLLGPSEDGLAILAELGLVYASKPRAAGGAWPALAGESQPVSLRLLVDAGTSGDLHSRALRVLEALEPSWAAGGGHLDPRPGADADDSAAWRFGLRFEPGPGEEESRLEGAISRRLLPPEREAVLLILRAAEVTR